MKNSTDKWCQPDVRADLAKWTNKEQWEKMRNSFYSCFVFHPLCENAKYLKVSRFVTLDFGSVCLKKKKPPNKKPTSDSACGGYQESQKLNIQIV